MPRATSWFFGLALAMSAVGAPGAARATVLYERSLDELARDAECVVAVVPGAERRSYWRGGRIVTEVLVDVAAVVTGRADVGERLTVRIPGGVVGGVGQVVAGAPTLDAGAPVVLFLTAPREGARAVLSMSAGVLPMRVDARGDVVVMPARTEGLTVLPDPARRASPRVELPPAGEALAVFVARLRAVSR